MPAILPVFIVYVFLGMRESQASITVGEVLTSFASAILITSITYFFMGAAVGWLWEKIRRKKNRMVFGFILAILAMIWLAAYCWLQIILFYR